MDWLGRIEFLWKLLQPIAVIALAVVLFLWNQNYREAKNAIIDMKEERLKEKEDQLRSKDEQLKSKDEQIKTKDEQIKTVEKENDLVKLMSAEALLKNFSAMKKVFEEQIANLETEKEEFRKGFDEANSKLREWESRGGITAEGIDPLKQEVRDLGSWLERKQIEIEAVRKYEHKFQKMTVKDVYGPVGAWFLSFKSRLKQGGPGHEDTLLANPLNIAKELAGIEKEAWEEFLDLTIEQAIKWAGTNVQNAQTKEDDKDRGGKS